ncbi:hypothetical protein ABZX77_30480 [Streptomyces sp. NPDC004237]|uniref:hypothetical protein n=1 Tax=Streptomyces sp. NPDC004237 TaxID=3154455 RepID=UPI00339EF9DA
MSPTSVPASLRGATSPRVEVHPEYEYTFGPEARQLAARGGLVLDLWQSDAIDLILAVRGDGRWACYEYAELVARQQGKGAVLEVRALAGLFLLGEKLILWSAHEYKTAMEGFRRFKQLLLRLGKKISENLIEVDGILVKVINTNGEESFERLDTGARLRFIARSKGSGRGMTGDCNLVDEAFAYTVEQQDALGPTTLAVDNPQFIYTSSPPLDGASGDVLYALRERAEAGGDDSLGYRDWGLEGDLDHIEDIDLDDRQLWARTCPSLGSRVREEAIVRMRRLLSDRGFAREILGLWPKRAVGSTVIDPAKWARMLDEHSQRDRDAGLALGVDISPLRDSSAICVYGLRADGMGHVQMADLRPGTKWLIPRLIELRNALEPLTIAMGRGTFAFLKTALDKADFQLPDDPEKPESGDLAVTGAIDMAAAAGQVLEGVREQEFRVVPNRHLDTAVAGAKTKTSGDTIAWTPTKSDVDITPLVAMSLARWSYIARSHLLEEADYALTDSVF